MKAVQRKIEITTPAGERLIARTKAEYDAILGAVWAKDPDAEVGLRWMRDDGGAHAVTSQAATAAGAA